MARLSKFWRLASHAFSLFFITYFLKHKSLNPVIQKKITRFLPDLKHILIWSTLPELTEYGQQHFIDKNCFLHNCYFTTNRSLFTDLRYFDAVIFNLQEVSEGNQELPLVRSHHQKYIFAANDSADIYPVCRSVYDGFFNWTWTYKSDSTIPYRFITVYNLENQELGNNFQWSEMAPLATKLRHELGTKHKAAAIFLDKCKTRSKREVFLKNLQKQLLKYNLTVDIYGKCGTLQCKRKNMKPCLWKLKKQYFFYLAFEESLATDFVTKHVLYAFENFAVPVVYGKAAYDRYLPPESFLNGRELGEEKLAQIMHQTIFDADRYLNYFKWKKYYTIKKSQVLDACGLCMAMNNPNWLNHQATYYNFRKWWNEDYEQRCNEDAVGVAKYLYLL